jgi:hypothetical protein
MIPDWEMSRSWVCSNNSEIEARKRFHENRWLSKP